MNEASAGGGGGPGPGPRVMGMGGGPPMRPGLGPMPMGPMGPMLGIMGGPPGGMPMRGGPLMGPPAMDPGFVGNMNAMMMQARRPRFARRPIPGLCCAWEFGAIHAVAWRSLTSESVDCNLTQTEKQIESPSVQALAA